MQRYNSQSYRQTYQSGANYKVIEFHGEAIQNMDTSGRLTISNMAVEAGATAGIILPDAETVRYLREEADNRRN